MRQSTKPRTALLDELLDPLVGCFSRRVARKLVELRANDATQRRLNELADKANEGELTTAEHREYDLYVQAIDVIGILQAKARRYLKNHADA
jgi:hypothetical protein